MVMRREMYNEGFFYQALPVDRFAVVPGESVDFDFSVKWMTSAFNRPILSGGLFTVGLFYVPFRLIWDGWVEFLTKGDIGRGPGSGGSTNLTAEPLPMTTVAWYQIFEAAGPDRPVNIFGRRAFKLIQNEFFGDTNFTGSFYSEAQVDDDAYTVMKSARNLDQLLSRMVAQADLGSGEVLTLPVVDDAVQLNLNGLRRELVAAKSMRRRDFTGEKYVDALMRMGVKLDWRVQQAPECLGVWKGDVQSFDTQSSENTQTGRNVSTLRGSVHCRCGRKFFAEHGLVMAVLVVKPTVHAASEEAFPPTHIAPDAWLSDKSEVFLGDNQAGTYGKSVDFLEPGIGTFVTPRFDYLRSGRSGVGYMSAEPFTLRHAPATFDQVVYPPPFFNATGAGQLDQMFAVNTFVRNVVRLPFSPDII